MVNVFTAFAMVFIAEMGDKTQLFLIGLSSKFKLKSIIIGVAAAIAVLNGAAVAIGYFIGGKIDATIIKFVAGAAFLAFAYTSLLPKSDEEEGVKKAKRGAALAVFLSFLLAELGDKTQLMTLTLSAGLASDGGSFGDAAALFGACSLGLFAADLIGMLVGYFLSKKLPESALGIISFIIFTAFGIYTVYEATSLVSGGDVLAVSLAVGGVTLIFAALCFITLFLINKKGKTVTGNEEGNSKDE